MSGHGEKLTRKQEEAIACLLTQPTLAKAAQAVGVHEKTLRTWLRAVPFRAAYRAAREDVLQQALGFVSDGLALGALVLRQIAQDTEAPASARVSAVRSLFDIACKDREMETLEARIADLEATVQATTAALAALQQRLPDVPLTP